MLIIFLVLVFHLFVWRKITSDGSYLRSWVRSFECGFVSQRLVEKYFSSTCFILLVFFVVFDLEVSLLLNLPFQGELFKKLLFYLFFLFLLSVGFSLEIKKGYVCWGY